MCQHPDYRECNCNELPDDPTDDTGFPDGATSSAAPIDTGRVQEGF